MDHGNQDTVDDLAKVRRKASTMACVSPSMTHRVLGLWGLRAH